MTSRSRDLAVTTVPSLLIAGGTTALVLSLSDRLPDPVATHWGPDGVDGTGAVSTLVGVLLGGAALFVVVSALITIFAGQSSITRRMSAAMATFVTATLAGVTGYSLWVQRDLADAYDAPDITAGLALTLLVATALAAGAAALISRDEPRDASSALSPDALTVDVPDGHRVAWIATTRMKNAVLLGAVVLIAPNIVPLFVGGWEISLVVSVLLTTAVIGLTSWTITINDGGLTARPALPVATIRIPASEIESAHQRTVSPLREFGGYGYRTALDGTVGIVVRGGDAVEVQRSGGRRWVFTIDGASEAAALLNTVAQRAR